MISYALYLSICVTIYNLITKSTEAAYQMICKLTHKFTSLIQSKGKSDKIIYKRFFFFSNVVFCDMTFMSNTENFYARVSIYLSSGSVGV